MPRARTVAALAAVLVAAALALTGCGGSGADPGSPDGGPVALPTPGPGDALPDLTVECTGGVGGVEEHLVIRAGTAVGSHRYPPGIDTTTLTAAERAAVAGALRQAATRTYRPAYQTKNVWDVWQYRIQIATAVVSADQLALPPQLADLVATLEPVRSRLSLVC